MGKNEDKIISEAKPHTEKKFRLVEKYVEAWAYKLLNNKYCNKLTLYHTYLFLAQTKLLFQLRFVDM